MSKHDGSQERRAIMRVWPDRLEYAIAFYTFRLAYFLPNAGPVWVREFGHNDVEHVIEQLEVLDAGRQWQPTNRELAAHYKTDEDSIALCDLAKKVLLEALDLDPYLRGHPSWQNGPGWRNLL